MIVNCSAPICGTGQTAGLVSANAVTYDTSSSAILPALNNCQIVATCLLLGRTATPEYVRIMLQRSFAREAGTLAALDAAAIVLGTSFADAALAAAVADLDFTGDTIRGRVTGVTGETINWTGAIWVSTTSF